MKKLLLILFIVVSVPAVSQNLTTLEYSMGFATGDMGDFIDKPSFRGFTIDYRGTGATQRWRWSRSRMECFLYRKLIRRLYQRKRVSWW